MTAVTEGTCPRGFDSYHVKLGDMLRGERATAGKSLEDVQEDLKIGVKYIDAIEEGNLSAFDTQGFIAGYVRSYARYLNLDGDKAYEQFCQETGFDGFKTNLEKSKSSRKSKSEDKPQEILMGPIKMPTEHWYEKVSFSAIGSLVVLMALVSSLGFAGWNVLQEVQRVQFSPVNEVPGAVSSISVLSDNGNVADYSPSLNIHEPSENQPVQTVTLDQLYRPQELEIPNVTPRDGPIAGINPETLGIYAQESNKIVPANIELESPVATLDQGPPNLDIIATRPAWIRIYLPDNSVLFEKIMNAGERYRMPTGVQDPLLKAGNSGAVYFMVGSKTYGPIGANGAVTREVSITQASIEENYGEVLNLFSGPLAPPINAVTDQTAKAILKKIQNN